MKGKTLGVLLIVLAVLTGLVFVVLMEHAPREGKRELGSLLLKDLPVNDIAAVSILGADGGGVQLVKNGNQWVVKNRFGYPADFSKLTGFVRKLRDAKIGRSFAASEKVLSRLHLRDPEDKTAEKEEKGTAVTFMDTNGKVLVRLIVGEPLRGGEGGMFPEGQYVLLGNRKTVYLVDKQFEGLGKTPPAWLKKDVIDVKADNIRKITCVGPDGKTVLYACSRPEKGKDLQLLHLPPGKQVNPASVNRLAGALSDLRIENVIDPAKAGASIETRNSSVIEYRLFNGMIYDLYPGGTCGKTDTCYLKISVRFENPPLMKTTSGDASKKEADKGKTADAGKTMEQKAETLNKKLGRWIFIIPKWKHDALVTDRASLLEKEKK